MQEVELTCEVTPVVRERLQQYLAGRKPDKIVVNDDRYYDTPAAQLYRQAVFVRVRTNGAVSQLQWKFDEETSEKQHLICTERTFLLSEEPLPEGVHTLFAHFLPDWQPASSWSESCMRNHLQELTALCNTRQIYRMGELTLCLDQVQDLGCFVEAEVMCEEGTDTQEARRLVQQFIGAIGGSPLSAGYVELSLQRTKPDLYQLGQYHL